MSIALKGVNLAQSAMEGRVSTWTIEVITTEQMTNRSSVREEVQTIGLILLLSAADPGGRFREFLEGQQSVDPEKVSAVLGLLGCEGGLDADLDEAGKAKLEAALAKSPLTAAIASARQASLVDDDSLDFLDSDD